ncbi:MAG: hypothetical protein ACKVKF_24435 [Rhodobacterales bacterium]|nr:hypothetical protein [Puniceibacterium antarcticum]
MSHSTHRGPVVPRPRYTLGAALLLALVLALPFGILALVQLVV